MGLTAAEFIGPAAGADTGLMAGDIVGPAAGAVTGLTAGDITGAGCRSAHWAASW